MRIIHRMSITSTQDVREELRTLGMESPGGDLITFEVDEASPMWPQVESWASWRKPLDVVTTTFTRDEVRRARWLELEPAWHAGYPQPNEDGFGFREVTYDLRDYCGECGIGLRQKASFQLKGEPNWGRNAILQLHWIFDEFFVTPMLWSSVFKPLDVGYRPLLNTKGAELRSVVQLDIPQEASIATAGLSGSRCKTCERTKYLPVSRGPFPPLQQEPTSPVVRTREYFGSGKAAHHRVLVRQDVAAAFAREGIRGATFRPLA